MLGSHPVGVFVPDVKDASRLQFVGVPDPKVVKSPPTYIVLPLTAMARTVALAFGSQVSGVLVPDAKDASRLRVVVEPEGPNVVKSPPTYILPLLTAMTRTVLSAFGSQDWGVPSLLFTKAIRFRVDPLMLEKSPPT
jgi:hypothetical protein